MRFELNVITQNNAKRTKNLTIIQKGLNNE